MALTTSDADYARGDAATLRKLLDEALEALDIIAEPPANPDDRYDHHKADRFVAKVTAKHIRSQLT